MFKDFLINTSPNEAKHTTRTLGYYADLTIAYTNTERPTDASRTDTAERETWRCHKQRRSKAASLYGPKHPNAIQGIRALMTISLQHILPRILTPLETFVDVCWLTSQMWCLRYYAFTICEPGCFFFGDAPSKSSQVAVDRPTVSVASRQAAFMNERVRPPLWMNYLLFC